MTKEQYREANRGAYVLRLFINMGIKDDALLSASIVSVLAVSLVAVTSIKRNIIVSQI